MRPMPELKVVEVLISDLYEYENNAKIHDHENVDSIANSIAEFGYVNPVLAWHDNNGSSIIVGGHGRVMAAKKEGLEKIPVIYVDHLSDQQRRELTHVLNQTTLQTGFDFAILEREFESIPDFDWEDFGFKMDTIMTDDEINEFFIEAVSKAEEKLNQPTPESHEQSRPVEAVSLRRTIICPECGHEFEL